MSHECSLQNGGPGFGLLLGRLPLEQTWRFLLPHLDLYSSAKISQMDLLQRDTNFWLCLNFLCCPRFLRSKRNQTLSLKQYVRGHHSPFHGGFMNIHPEKSRKPRQALNHRSNLWSVESPKTLGWQLFQVSWR